MGNLFSFEIFSIDVTISPNVHSDTQFWARMTFFLVFLILLALIFAFAYYRCKRIRIRTPPLTPPLMAIVCIFLLVLSIRASESAPISYKRRGSLRRFSRPIIKQSLPILSSAALYLGLESLAYTFQEHPEFSALLISFIAVMSTMVALILLKVALFLLHKFGIPSRLFPAPPPINNPNPHNSAIEMTELTHLRDAVQELVMRSDPPRA